MKTYEFDVVLKDVSSISDEQADALFSAGRPADSVRLRSVRCSEFHRRTGRRCAE